MHRFGLRFLIALLAVNLAGALPLCAMTMANLQNRADDHACCGESTKPTEPKDCSSCDQQKMIGVSKIDLTNLQWIALDTATPIVLSPRSVVTVELTSAPPILVDLVHSACQLTV